MPPSVRRSQAFRAPTPARLAAVFLLALTAGCAGPAAEGDAAAPDTRVGAPADAESPGPVFSMEEVAPGVHVAVVLPAPDAYAFANSLVVVGEDGVLVVDTQQSPRAARALIRRIRALTTLPVRWVVNTHWHGDHVNGNVAYREAWPDVRFLATPATVEGMRGPGVTMRDDDLASLPGSIEERRRWLDEDSLPDGRALTPELREQVAYSLRMRTLYLAELDELEVVEPEGVVAGRMPVDVGGRTVELLALGPAHTTGDLVVHVPDAGVVAVGDLLEEAAPWIDGADLAGWAAALGALQALDASVVVPAHGAVQRGTELLDGEAALFRDLVAAARAQARRPDEEAVPAVVAALAPHRGFLEGVGLVGEGFDEWAEAAAAQALARAREDVAG